jgi:Ca2+-binding RTX toxin-like protein
MSRSDTGPGTDKDTVESTAQLQARQLDREFDALDTAVSGTGNAGNNLLIVDAQNNTLDGAGGVDTMKGGAGSDTYIVDNKDDLIVENKGEGTADTVQSSVTFTLAANIENLTLTGADTIDGAGNDLANVITGNATDNKLQGFAAADKLTGNDGSDTLDGGQGNDTMIGGQGNDTYVVDSVLDVIVEKNGQGTTPCRVRSPSSSTRPMP